MSDLHIKITPEEKHHLDALASAAGKSVSAIVKERIADLLSGSGSAVPLSIIERPNTAIRSRNIHVRVSDEEYARIKSNADSGQITKYARQVLLTGTTPISIIVETDDIKELLGRIYPLYRQIINAMAALKAQSQIHEQQLDQIMELQEQIYESVIAFETQVYKNRVSIRRSAIREIRNKIKKELQSQREPS